MHGRVRISPKVDLQNLERAGLWLVGHPPIPKGNPDTTGRDALTKLAPAVIDHGTTPWREAKRSFCPMASGKLSNNY